MQEMQAETLNRARTILRQAESLDTEAGPREHGKPDEAHGVEIRLVGRGCGQTLRVACRKGPSTVGSKSPRGQIHLGCCVQNVCQ